MPSGGRLTMLMCMSEHRADSFFYIAQHHNMMREFGKAWMELKACLTLPVPRRSLFVWMDMYNCLRCGDLLTPNHAHFLCSDSGKLCMRSVVWAA